MRQPTGAQRLGQALQRSFAPHVEFAHRGQSGPPEDEGEPRTTFADGEHRGRAGPERPKHALEEGRSQARHVAGEKEHRSDIRRNPFQGGQHPAQRAASRNAIPTDHPDRPPQRGGGGPDPAEQRASTDPDAGLVAAHAGTATAGEDGDFEVVEAGRDSAVALDGEEARVALVGVGLEPLVDGQRRAVIRVPADERELHGTRLGRGFEEAFPLSVVPEHPGVRRGAPQADDELRAVSELPELAPRPERVILAVPLAHLLEGERVCCQ
jgi:hypothetical protein